MKYLSGFMLIAVSAIGCNDMNRTGSTTSTPNTMDKGTMNRGTMVEPNNTGVNVRDRNGDAKTPLDQNENKTDIGITADIRKRVVDTKMSTDAHNVKIITQDGRVTLRGPVKSGDEKKSIEEIARAVAGDTNVDSQLEVKSNG